MQNNNPTSKWTLLLFSALNFYCAGVAMMLYFVAYPPMEKAKEHWQDFIHLFQEKMQLWLLIPSILYLIAIVLFAVYNKNDFSKRLHQTAVGLGVVTVLSIFLLILPSQKALVLSSQFDVTIFENLRQKALFFQVIPSILLILLNLWLLNQYFSQTKLMARWVFIFLFALLFYSNGTNNIEVLVQYPLWRVVGENDWLSYRQAISFSTFLAVYLFPGFVTNIFILLLFWLRPKGINIVFPLLFLVITIIGTYFTATYFVPEIQFQLDKAYSSTLIDDLINKDFLLRRWSSYLYLILLGIMFFKMERNEMTA